MAKFEPGEKVSAAREIDINSWSVVKIGTLGRVVKVEESFWRGGRYVVNFDGEIVADIDEEDLR